MKFNKLKKGIKPLIFLNILEQIFNNLLAEKYDNAVICKIYIKNKVRVNICILMQSSICLYMRKLHNIYQWNILRIWKIILARFRMNQQLKHFKNCYFCWKNVIGNILFWHLFEKKVLQCMNKEALNSSVTRKKLISH